MYNVIVTLAVLATPLPAGVVYGHTNLTVTDAAGAVQNFALNGSETPPWSTPVAGLADGESSYVAQAVDSAGNAIGDPIKATYSPTVATFPAPTGITVTPA
jgi:hypothetical protein